MRLTSGIELKFFLQQRNSSEKQLHRNKRKKQTIVSCLCACLATARFHFGPHSASLGLHVKTSYVFPYFTTGRWGTSPPRGPPLPYEQALTHPHRPYSQGNLRLILGMAPSSSAGNITTRVAWIFSSSRRMTMRVESLRLSTGANSSISRSPPLSPTQLFCPSPGSLVRVGVI